MAKRKISKEEANKRFWKRVNRQATKEMAEAAAGIKRKRARRLVTQ